MPVRVATGAGKRLGARKIGLVEGNPTSLELGMGGILQGNRPDHSEAPGIGDVEQGNRVLHRIQDPCPLGLASVSGRKSNSAGNGPDLNPSQNFAAHCIHRENLVRTRCRNEECGIVPAHLYGKGCGQGHPIRRVFGGQGFEIEKLGLAGFPALKANPGNLVEKSPVAQLLEPVLFGSGQAVYLVPGIGLGDEDCALGVQRQSIEQGTKGIDGLNQLVGLHIEYKQVPVGNAGMLHNIGNVPQGQNVIFGNGMLVGIKGNEFAIDLIPARELGLVVRLEGDDVKPVVANHDGSRILSPDRQALGHFSGDDIHNSDLVFRGKRDISLLVVGKGDSHGLVKAGRLGLRVNILNSRDNVHEGGLRLIQIDHVDRIGNMIGHPEFPSVRSQGKADWINPDGNATKYASGIGMQNVDRVTGRVGHEDMIPMGNDRTGMWAHERRMPDLTLA